MNSSPLAESGHLDGGQAGLAVAACDLEVRYGKTVALEKAALQLQPAETVAVVGSSGSGKTSLLLCLAGLLRPSRGSVEIGGQDLWGRSRHARDSIRRRHIGYVAQFSDLVPELTNAENVALPLRLMKLSAAVSAQRAQERLDQLGVGHLGGRFPHEVSGGEMQRVAIARSLVHQPDVLLADEPSGALDEENRLLVLDNLLTAARELRTAVVLVTHDASLASAASRVVRMAAGRMQVAGS